MRRIHLTWLFVVGVIAVLFIFLRQVSDSENDLSQAPSGAANLDAPQPGREPERPAADANQNNSAPTTIPSTRQGASPTVDNSSEVEVCGVGTVKLDLSNYVAVDKYWDSLTEDVLPLWVSALRKSKDVHAKAIGIALQSQIEIRNAVEEAEQRLGPCPDTNEACQARIRMARLETSDRGAPEQTEALIRLAKSTRDPAIYALSTQLCRRPISTDDPCNSISIEQWIAIDPDNAVPWFGSANAASFTRDVAARNEAREQAAKAKRIEHYDNLFYKASLAALPSDLSPLQRSALSFRLINFQRSRRVGVDWLSCAPPWFDGDEKRREACDALAELHAKQETTLLDKNMAFVLGKGLGWPKEKLQVMETETLALTQALIETLTLAPASEWPNPFNCAAVQSQNAYFEKLAAMGELAAVRSVLEKSGSSMEELARRRKARMDWERENRRKNASPQ